MCRSKADGGRRCSCQSGSPVVETVIDLMAAAARDENTEPPRFRSEGYYRLRGAARDAWRATVNGIRSRLEREGANPYEEVPATEARTAIGGAIRQVEGMGWVTANERRTAVRRLSRAQRNARKNPLTRMILAALLESLTQLILGRDNARRVYALAGLVEAARLQRERRTVEAAREAAARDHEDRIRHYSETF